MNLVARRVVRYVEGRLVPAAEVARACGVEAGAIEGVLREIERGLKPGWHLTRTLVRPRRCRNKRLAIGVFRDAFVPRRKVPRQGELPGLTIEPAPSRAEGQARGARRMPFDGPLREVRVRRKTKRQLAVLGMGK